MKNVWSAIHPYKLAAGCALFFMLVELIVELLQPLLMAKIINEGVMEQNLEVVMLWGGIMLFFSIIALAAGFFNTFYASHVSQSFAYDIRKSVFRKVQELSYLQFSLFPAGSLITRMTNDIQQLQNTMFMLLRIMARAPLLIIGGVMMAFFVHPKLAWLLAVVVPLLFVFLFFLMNKGGKLFATVQDKLDSVNNVMGENLAGMKLIRAFLRRNYEVKRFEEANEDLQERTVKALRFMEITMPVLLLLMNITVVFLLWFGSREMLVGSANVGEVVAIVNYATRITLALSVFSFIIMIFSRAKASAHRVNEVLHTKGDMMDEETEAEPRVKGSIVFDTVSFKYPGQNRWALNNLSFTIEAGKTLAILGATGSGKTTLINLIPRLIDTVSGNVKIDGMNVKDWKQKLLRGKIGIVPQESLLFTGTIKENLLWGNREASDEEVAEACRHAQIQSSILALPDKLDTMIGQKGVNLSGGQRQRLAIARALIRKPKILLFDDSTSALDSKTEKQLLHDLSSYDSTKIFITQKISTAVNADKIILLQHGEKVAEGTHAELSKQSALYQAILKSQMEEGSERHALEATK